MKHQWKGPMSTFWHGVLLILLLIFQKVIIFQHPWYVYYYMKSTVLIFPLLWDPLKFNFQVINNQINASSNTALQRRPYPKRDSLSFKMVLRILIKSFEFLLLLLRLLLLERTIEPKDVFGCWGDVGMTLRPEERRLLRLLHIFCEAWLWGGRFVLMKLRWQRLNILQRWNDRSTKHSLLSQSALVAGFRIEKLLQFNFLSGDRHTLLTSWVMMSCWEYSTKFTEGFKDDLKTYFARLASKWLLGTIFCLDCLDIIITSKKNPFIWNALQKSDIVCVACRICIVCQTIGGLHFCWYVNS